MALVTNHILYNTEPLNNKITALDKTLNSLKIETITRNSAAKLNVPGKLIFDNVNKKKNTDNIGIT